MSGTLNENNEVAKYTDSGFNLKVGKINHFVMMVNIEELNFGSHTPRADLMLLYRKEQKILEIVLFELKNVKAVLRSEELDKLVSHVKNKFYSTISLFDPQIGGLDSNNKNTKLAGIFSNAVKDSMKANKTYYLVIPSEFKSQVIKFKTTIREKNKKRFRFEILTENEEFKP